MSKKLIFCNCGAQLIGADRLLAIAEYLKQSERPATQISDLCGCAVNRKTQTSDAFLAASEVLVIACYPRAVKLMLKNCDINQEILNIKYLNFRELNNHQIFEGIDFFFSETDEKGKFTAFESDAEWPSWYPMIDPSRCNSCGQCSDFCLFGVYEKLESKVVVTNPRGCKNNCPACGRICPQTAIIFPKYDQKGAIAGADDIDEMAEHQRQLNDVDTILGSNIYKTLEMRKAKRQSIIRSNMMQQAMNERQKALDEKSGKQ